MLQLPMHAEPDYNAGLRWYQREAVDAVYDAFEGHRAVLTVLATGLGKTRIFSAVAHRWKGRVLVLAHRTELVEQGRDHIERVTGELVEVEQAELRAGHGRIVMASVQTLQKKRLERYRHDHFGLIIVDEAHHAAAKTYRNILRHFEHAKVLGVTATPDRGDKKALGTIFTHCAYEMGVQAGIEAGYLVPLTGVQVNVESLDLSNVSVSNGDLSVGELDEEMLKATESVVKSTLQIVPEHEQAIIFTPGVRTAHSVADRINELLPNMPAASLDGNTPDEERKRIVDGFRSGKVRFLANCMIATEGFDAPTASHVVMARPTKSRSLYSQMVGRITRVLPGVVDHVQGRDESAIRRDLIKASRKTQGTIVDFVGNAGKHSLAGPLDVLGGEMPDDVRERAKKKLEQGTDIVEAVKASQQEIAALREMQRIAMESKLRARMTSFDPFSVMHLGEPIAVSQHRNWEGASSKQRELLAKWGVEDKHIERMSREDANKLMRTFAVRRDVGLASFKQLRVLKKHGFDKPNVTVKQASRAIDVLAKSNWRPDAAAYSEITDILNGK